LSGADLGKRAVTPEVEVDGQRFELGARAIVRHGGKTRCERAQGISIPLGHVSVVSHQLQQSANAAAPAAGALVTASHLAAPRQMRVIGSKCTVKLTWKRRIVKNAPPQFKEMIKIVIAAGHTILVLDNSVLKRRRLRRRKLISD
jgi:hypothetical protein